MIEHLKLKLTKFVENRPLKEIHDGVVCAIAGNVFLRLKSQWYFIDHTSGLPAERALATLLDQRHNDGGPIDGITIEYNIVTKCKGTAEISELPPESSMLNIVSFKDNSAPDWVDAGASEAANLANMLRKETLLRNNDYGVF